MGAEKATKPTIETVLERINTLEERINANVDAKIAALEERLEIRLDRIESLANTTRAEMLGLRADFKELRTQLREHFPALS